MLSRLGLQSFGLGLLVAAMAGCGQSESLNAPELYPVTGKVTMDGEPLVGAVLSFLPKGDTAGQVVTATTADGGSYSAMYSNGKPGCPTGQFQIYISKLVMPDGSPIPDGKTAADVQAVDKVPPKYRSSENPESSIMIPVGGKSELNFELKSR
jgi:hypothetical protein